MPTPSGKPALQVDGRPSWCSASSSTILPVNEPGTGYRHRTNRQEGSHRSPVRQAAMADAGHDAACIPGTDAPPRSVVTLLLTRNGAAAPRAAG